MFLFLAAPAGAATIPATSCSDAHVQSAINTAAAGDTVTVPAGNCTWTTTVTITSKRLVLQGAGINVTTITDRATGANALTITGASATNFVRVTGFTFIKGTSHPDGMIQLFGTEASVAFRIHHIRLVMATAGSRGIYPVAVYGLIDHNTFDITAARGSIQVVSIDGSHAGADGGFTPWTRPLTLGTVNAVYIEDNVFNVVTIDEDSIDAYAGARFVVRYNTFNGAHIGFHGTDSGSMRSPVSHEVYNNTFINNSGGTFRGGTVRGGTGVWFNNTYGGTSPWAPIILMCYRCCETGNTSDWQYCNGTNWELRSTNFSTEASRTCSVGGGVKFCSGNRDLVCTGDATCAAAGAGTCSAYFDHAGAPGGYLCRDQPGAGPTQVSAPLYQWNNGSMTFGTYDGGVPCPWGSIDAFIAEGRDYFNGTARPGYTAYTYPHPLQTYTLPSDRTIP